MKILRWLKERYICLCGFHGYDNDEDARLERCSFCGCHFEGWLPKGD